MEGNRSEERNLGSGIEQSPMNGDNTELGDTILFVGGLAKSCTDDELREPFLKFGDVLSVRVQRSKSTSKPLGYGFVQMASVEQADKAKEALNKSFIGDHQVDINWAGRNRVLLVSNLAPSVSIEEILDLFSRFGDIEKEKTVEGECSGKLTTRCMTIHFLTRENAIRARNVLDRYTYKGNTIRVEWWRSVEEVVPRSSPQTPEQLALSSLPSSPAQSYANSIGPPVELSQIDDQNQGYYTQRRPRPATTSAYFRFESKSDEAVSESVFKTIFSSYGVVLEVSMKTTFIDGETNRQRGYGFVHFSNDEAGRAAVLAASRDLQRSERLGVLLSAEVSNTFKKQMSGGMQSYASCAFSGPATRYFYVHPQALGAPSGYHYPMGIYAGGSHGQHPPSGYTYYPGVSHMHPQSRANINSLEQRYWTMDNKPVRKHL